MNLGRSKPSAQKPPEPAKPTPAPVRRAVLDRLPPHSHEAEQSVLGCCLLDPVSCLSECAAKVRAGSEVFYDLRHQTIYDAMSELFGDGQPVDAVTLQQRLKDKGRLEEVGGVAYLMALPDYAPSAANLPRYLEIVQEKHLLRRLINVCTQAASGAYEFDGKVSEMLDAVERDILAVRGIGDFEDRPDAKELVSRAIGVIEAMHQRQGAVSGVATGLADLDKLTSGQQKGELNILAGVPSMGKTALAMNIAEHAAVACLVPVGVFSLEMTSESLMTRMLCSSARVNLRSVRDGFLAERDFPKLTMASGKLAKAALHFDDTSDLSIHELRARARRMWQKHKIGLFVVDYLQLMNAHGGGRKVENRQQEVADIASGLKGMAKEFKVTVLALSQLNEDGALRESRAIGQHADGVWVLQKAKSDDSDEKDSLSADAVPVDLLVKKQRNGPTGVVNLTFLKCYTRFESAAKMSDEDVPQDHRGGYGD